ncbi:ABC transporter substrate-binding protein [Xanthobacter dioxanivorans]|uniref:ABC transporter substrate-binding protein n=1 Tax=Xanthobacter dioxanivorans TaxID=2528964 RepID=A0A974SI97_9HYPH|nr:ABC transporter substrate-binding protein [Xanthobacter dioxanivorans]QRG06217.1 ABC transporter substrate-binding protein [Xanthobacter dioxanivorans]
MIPRLFCTLLLVVLAGGAGAQTRPFTDDLGRTVEVPVHPRRIVSLHDLDLTLPLIELGVMPVASHGRVRPDGTRFLRAGKLLTGVDFDTAPIAFLGANAIDLEAVVAAKPDLIVTSPTRDTPLAQLEAIAPTVSIEHLKGGPAAIYGKLAALTGSEARLAALQQRYAAQIAQLKGLVDTARITVSAFQANQGKLTVFHTDRALGRVLRDAGFRFPPIIDAIPEGGRMDVSAEHLPDLDADFIFGTFRSDQGGGPGEEVAALEKVMPGWCRMLKACREGRHLLLPRDETISNTYAALSLLVAVVEAQVLRREVLRREAPGQAGPGR